MLYSVLRICWRHVQKSRIRIAWIVAAIACGLLPVAWQHRSQWLPSVFARPAEPQARSTAAVAASPRPVPSAAAIDATVAAAGTPFTADICGVGKVALLQKPHDDSDDAWVLESHVDADGKVVDDPPQLLVDPNALSPRDQAIEEWVRVRASQDYANTASALRRSGDARLLALSMVLGEHDTVGNNWSGGPPGQTAALANSTGDPVVYGIAYSACRSLNVPEALKMHLPGCESLDVRRWTALDPQNAVPWLVAALEADVAGDSAAVADAMHHAAQARTYDTYAKLLANAVATEIRGDPDSVEHVAIEADLIPLVSSSREYSLAPVLRYCARSHMDIKGRRTDCDAISTLLLVSGKTPNELEVGLHVGQITDPDQPALSSLLSLRNQLMFGGHPAGAHWTCQHKLRQQEIIQGYLRSGEVAARLKLRDQFDPALPAPTKEQNDQADLYLDRGEVLPIVMESLPAGP